MSSGDDNNHVGHHPDERDLEKRIDRLEGGLDDILLALYQISAKLDGLAKAKQAGEQLPQKPAPAAAAPLTQTARPAEPQGKQAAGTSINKPASQPPAGWAFGSELHWPAAFRRAQFWFNLIGIVLVLLGVVFLYKYSIDQGWITEPMKVASGVILGVALLVLGLFLHSRQRFFSQMMMGAGIATLYISGFAAFQVYALISYPAAIGWMAAVTVLAFVLSVMQDEDVLSLVGTIGGLATPLVLHEQFGSRAEVVIFSCAVLAGAGAVYFYKGWRPLLWVSVLGGWGNLLFIYSMDHATYRGFTATDKKAMQAGVVFAAVLFWALPVLREWLSAGNPERWKRPQLISSREEFADIEAAVNQHVYLLSISTPFISLFFTRAIWHLTNRGWGWVALGVTAVFALAFLALRTREGVRRLAYTQALVAIALFTMAIALLLEGDARFVAITAEASALALVGWWLDNDLIRVLGHGFFLVMAGWLAQRLLDQHAQGTAMLNAAALSELLLIIAAAAVSFLVEQKEIRYAYQLAAYVALFALFLREFSDLANGQGYVTVAWGVCAIALLAAGIVGSDRNWRMLALVTLFVVVAKLLIVDLAAVKAIWRVLLFVGFGGLFLVLSYFFQSLWKPDGAAIDDAQTPLAH